MSIHEFSHFHTSELLPLAGSDQAAELPTQAKPPCSLSGGIDQNMIEFAFLVLQCLVGKCKNTVLPSA